MMRRLSACVLVGLSVVGLDPAQASEVLLFGRVEASFQGGGMAEHLGFLVDQGLLSRSTWDYTTEPLHFSLRDAAERAKLHIGNRTGITNSLELSSVAIMCCFSWNWKVG